MGVFLPNLILWIKFPSHLTHSCLVLDMDFQFPVPWILEWNSCFLYKQYHKWYHISKAWAFCLTQITEVAIGGVRNGARETIFSIPSSQSSQSSSPRRRNQMWAAGVEIALLPPLQPPPSRSSPHPFPSLSLPQFKFCDAWDQAQGLVFSVQVLYLRVTPQPCSLFSLRLFPRLLLEHMLQIQILISSQNAIQMYVGVVCMSISTTFGFQSVYHLHKLGYLCSLNANQLIIGECDLELESDPSCKEIGKVIG